MSEVEVNKYGTNKKIKYHILSDDEMRKIGFTDRNTESWYFSKHLIDTISFNVTIPKDGVSDLRIDVIDEDFLQIYNYEYILSKNPNFLFALNVKNLVEEQMEYLQNAGVINEFKNGMYI